MLPALATDLLLTIAVSALIGIGLREYYERENKFDTFGTVRTFIFFGMLGYLLYQIPVPAHAAFLLGFAVIAPFLLAYYNHKVRQHKSHGMIGVIIAFLTYAIGPIATHEPHWFLIATASNNLMKAAYVYLFGNRRTAHRTALGMAVTVLLSCLFVAWV